MGQPQPGASLPILFVDITGLDCQGCPIAQQRKSDAILGTRYNSWWPAFYSEVSQHGAHGGT